MATVRFYGQGDLIRNLREMKKATARTTLYRVLMAAAKPIDQSWRATAPRLSGGLAKSGGIVKSSTLVGNAAFAQGMRDSGGDKGAALKAKRAALRDGDRAFAEITLGPGRHPKAVQQEFGNVNHPAHPFMRPAWEANKEAAMASIVTQMRVEVEKTAARLAKNAARQAAKR